MRKWNSDIYRDNHLRLMRFHAVFSLIYLLIFLGGIFALEKSLKEGLLLLFVVGWPFFMHGLLSYGSFRKVELSRKASEVVFAILLVAFPIGTFLSMYLLLPATQWKDPEVE